MPSLLYILGLGFGISLALTPLARALGRRYGLVDRPDGRRKVHSQPTPVVGGIAILLSVTAAVAAGLLLPTSLRDRLEAQGLGLNLSGLLLAAAVICAVGMGDDLFGLRLRYKMLGQLAAVAIVMGSGVSIENIRVFDWVLALGPLAVPFTAFWLLGAINSLNLLDGMDGLLSCVGLIICLAMAGMAVMGGQWLAAAATVALAGALLGFLCYNFPPATIFLGDAGSMLIGLGIGVLAIQSSLKGPATCALAAPLAVLTIPILDTTAAILRRKLTGRSIYSTDRGHMHHCLQRRGLSNRGVLLAVSLFCSLTLVGAWTSLAFQSELLALLSAAAVVGILLVTRLFGNAEARLAKERFIGLLASFRQRPPSDHAHQMEVRLQGSADWKELWGSLSARAASLSWKGLFLDVNAPAIHEGYHARWTRLQEEPEVNDCWRVEVPLVVDGHILGRLAVAGNGPRESLWERMTALAEVVGDCEAVLARLVAARTPGAPANGAIRQDDFQRPPPIQDTKDITPESERHDR